MAIADYIHCVVIDAITPNEVMEIVRELREKCLAQGTDFDFKYNPKQYDSTGFDLLSSNNVEFYFRDGKWATFFRMKYGDNNN